MLSRWKREQILDGYEEITGDNTWLLDAAGDYTVVIETRAHKYNSPKNYEILGIIYSNRPGPVFSSSTVGKPRPI